jgi:hypothetical protein
MSILAIFIGSKFSSFSQVSTRGPLAVGLLPTKATSGLYPRIVLGTFALSLAA